MRRENFTARTIAGLQCDTDKKQTIFSDIKTPGLGLRVTKTGSKSYIYETKLHGKTLRITIGNVKAWPLNKAQAEAARLKVMTDQGIDPREVKAEKKAIAFAKQQQEKLESITFGEAWDQYIDTRKPRWSESHYKDHLKMTHSGGEKRYRSNKLTIPGCLASFTPIRLKDISQEILTEWAKKESEKRPTQARLALRLLRAFLNWCAEHNQYHEIVKTNSANKKTVREILGKAQVKNDVLQREQLSAWFKAVRQIQNPVISAYLQTALLTGRRREEVSKLRWENIDFQWNSITLKDKVERQQTIPLTPYVAHLLSNLPRRNEWVFSSRAAATGRLAEPRIAHNKACAIAGLELTIHGLRRTFASLCEWVEMPEGISAQIQGHKPQSVREKNYIRRPLDLLRVWHIKIEEWILKEARVEFQTSTRKPRKITT